MSVDASNALLAWYAVDKRSLPWRAEAGRAPDPYRVWLSEIMLQQTTVAAVKPYFRKFTAAWPTVEALAAADEAEVMAAWAGLGYYARARNLIACAREVTARGGSFPASEKELVKLPGIGRYTAAAISAIAFGRRSVVVDANVERVISRLFAIETPLPAARPLIYARADEITPERHAGDFAQAMMDLGSAICTPKTPDCAQCPIAPYCHARIEGRQTLFPVKSPRTKRPERKGFAYWIEHDGHVLLVRRPSRGLLGGMLALPTGRWAAGVEPGDGEPFPAVWENAGAVDHVFTHFALNLRILCANVPTRSDGLWWPVERIKEAGLPTVFAKAADRALAWRAAA